MPSMLGIGVVGITKDGKRYSETSLDDYGGGGPLTAEEAIDIIVNDIKNYGGRMFDHPWESFEIHDLKLGKGKSLVYTLRWSDLV